MWSWRWSARMRLPRRGRRLAAVVAAALPLVLAACVPPPRPEPAAQPRPDPIARCEEALRTARWLSELLPACAPLHGKPRCQAAMLATSDPSNRAGHVLDVCAREYCPELREPRPAACGALSAEGVHVDSVEQVGALLQELGPAILAHEHGSAAMLRLEAAVRRSRLVVRARAYSIALALCSRTGEVEARTLQGDVVPPSPEIVERLAPWREAGATCAVREDGGAAEPGMHRLVLATQAGPQARPVDRLVVELRFRPGDDAFALESVTEAERMPGSSSLAYRTPSGPFLLPPERDPETPATRLRIEMRAGGISLLVGRRPVGPGCALDQRGTTFPSGDGHEDDVEALRRCVDRLRSELPALRGAREVDLRCEREVLFRRVSPVMAMLRVDAEGRPLFQTVNLGTLD